MLARFGLTVEAVAKVVVEAPSLEELGELSHDDIQGFCKTIRRPGGQIVPATGGAPINDPGTAIGTTSEAYLQACAWAVRALKWASRTTHPDYFTRGVVKSWKILYLAQKDYTESKTLPDATTFNSDWPKAFETLDDHIKQRRTDGLKISLGYLTRKDSAVPPEATDPRTNYVTLEDEHIARCPHTMIDPVTGDIVPTPYYHEDNKKLWLILADIFRNTHSYPFMKGFARAKDGRGAYNALFQHYLGPNNTMNLASKAEADMSKLRYTGESKRFTFEKYITGHKDCHNVFDGLVQYGYAGMDEPTRVRRFISGINHSALNSVKVQVFATPDIAISFEKTVNLYKTFITQSGLGSAEGDARIAAVGTNNSARPGPAKAKVAWSDQKASPKVDVDLRFYSRDEYRKLSDDQKLKLKRLREARGDTPSPNKNQGQKKAKSGGDGPPGSTRMNPDFAKRIAALEQANSSKTIHPKKLNFGNRSHPSLKRNSSYESDGKSD
jgi:hypothetical protein